ncbi:hypothetical protein HanIR_Chr06g0259861 [Helianthus annuus]|nr:hypothetical protein HanIR_Chr06g0259861 [Helianthus annuus]
MYTSLLPKVMWICAISSSIHMDVPLIIRNKFSISKQYIIRDIKITCHTNGCMVSLRSPQIGNTTVQFILLFEVRKVSHILYS